MFFHYAVVYVWFNPVGYNVSEDAGVATLMIERIGANGIPVNISITTQDLNATGTVNISTVDSWMCDFLLLVHYTDFHTVV